MLLRPKAKPIEIHLKNASAVLLGFATGLSYFKSKSAPFLQSEHWQEEDSTSAKWQEDAGT